MKEKEKKNPVPHSVPEIELTKEEKEYLIHQDDEMLVFGDKRLFACFIDSGRYYFDGTFKSVTKELFYQLYTIHFESNGGVFPVFYALLKNKKSETYQKLLEIIEN